MIKGIKINLSGDDYVIPPLNLASLEELQDRLASFNGGIDKEAVSTVIDAAFHALQRNYPDITRDVVRQIIGLENMHDVMTAVMDVSGLRRKDIEAEEASGEATAGSP